MIPEPIIITAAEDELLDSMSRDARQLRMVYVDLSRDSARYATVGLETAAIALHSPIIDVLRSYLTLLADARKRASLNPPTTDSTNYYQF